MHLEGKTIYLLCPAYSKTGGPELLHQLANLLNRLGFNAVMAYIPKGKSQDYVHPELSEYGNPYINYLQIEDESRNLLIIPEIYVAKSRKFKKIKKAIWWLSVDFFASSYNPIACYKERGFFRTILHSWRFLQFPLLTVHTVPYHLCQSYYAIQFLKSHGIKDEKIAYLSDYLNDTYLDDSVVSFKDRKPYVLYNPKKGKKFTDQLMKYRPDLRWFPIQNMTTQEVRQLLLMSMVYIDFGSHPGKDRIPREAAISGCCVITGKNGAAKYYEDIPIPDEFKFDANAENIPDIIRTIDECIRNYDEQISKFEGYRTFIKGEKGLFIEDTKKIFAAEKKDC